jgi:hypothetical protein
MHFSLTATLALLASPAAVIASGFSASCQDWSMLPGTTILQANCQMFDGTLHYTQLETNNCINNNNDQLYVRSVAACHFACELRLILNLVRRVCQLSRLDFSSLIIALCFAFQSNFKHWLYDLGVDLVSVALDALSLMPVPLQLTVVFVITTVEVVVLLVLIWVSEELHLIPICMSLLTRNR